MEDLSIYSIVLNTIEHEEEEEEGDESHLSHIRYDVPPLGNFEAEMKELNYELSEDVFELIVDPKNESSLWDLNALSPTEEKEIVDSTCRPSAGSILYSELYKENLHPRTDSIQTISESASSMSGPRADEEFVDWLKEQREARDKLNIFQVKSKVKELILIHGDKDVEGRGKWFFQWHERREERSTIIPEDESLNPVHRKETQNLAYPPAFKLEVAWYALRYSQYAAAKIFGVARRRIFDWMRQIPKLEDLLKKGHIKKLTGRGPKNRDIDQALYQWYCQKKASGARPKSCHVQKKAREIYSANGYLDMKCSYGWFKRWSQRFCIQLRNSYDDTLIEWILTKYDSNSPLNSADLQNKSLNIVNKEDPSFKASAGWASRFCRRHRDYLDPDQGGLKALPQHLEERSTQFLSMLQTLFKEKDFLPSSIGCVDELPLQFPLGLDFRKKDSSFLHVPGMEEAHANIILSTLADGTLLPPMLVIKGDGKKYSEFQRLSSLSTSGILLLIKDEDAYITDQVMNLWLHSLWFKDSRSQGPSLLLADSFSSHSSSEFQKSFSFQTDGCLAILPSGCSSSLQPLHRGVKFRFRSEMEAHYRDYISQNQKKRSSHYKIESSKIIKWIQDIYFKLTTEKEWIKSSFVETKIISMD